ncbi:MAG: hypothetical protein ACQEW8_07335 [Actinomycetota bacterium]
MTDATPNEETVTEEDKRITRADLRTMTPEQINEARKSGDLDHLLKGI